MTPRHLITLILFLSCLYTSGCATVLTTAYPPIHETRHGESIQGDTIGFSYAVTEEKNDLVLHKQPVCRQNIQLVNIKRKQLHGVIPAVLEMPFFGLGLLDLVVAGVYTRATVDEEKGDTIPGVEVSICGDYQIAPGQAVLIQYPGSVTFKNIQTNDVGKILLKDILPSNAQDRRFTIFVKEPTGLSYVKTYDKTMW
ncbi:MAG: hypothetical protein KKD44_14755 [Proteobacteria bacterium]|nr:hypothetical protein [Pseudomonadota bacterium]